MEKPLIIPIIGKARNGKDTVAQYLKEEIEKRTGKRYWILDMQII